MRKMFNLLIALFIMYMAYQFAFTFFSSGHDLTYFIKVDDKNVQIREILYNKKDVTSGYYFEITIDNMTIPFKVLNTYKKQKNIVQNVELLYGDQYKCVNIILKDTTNPSDIKCYKNDVIYFYNTIKGKDSKLDELVMNASYDANLYINDETVSLKEKIEYYSNNYVSDDTIFISGYKGLYLFGNEITSLARYVPLYAVDRYEKKLERQYGKTYITPDYNKSHEFDSFIISNISNGYIDYIYSNNMISFNSFIQGNIENKVYLIDIENKKQYQIDLKKKTVEEIGNENRGAQLYIDGNWVTKNINEIIDNKEVFEKENDKNFDNVEYSKIITIGNNNKIYYLVQKNGDKFDVYAVYEQDEKHHKNYLFTCTDMNRIASKEDRLYFIDGTFLKVFVPNMGTKTISHYNEFKYNSNLNYYIY